MPTARAFSARLGWSAMVYQRANGLMAACVLALCRRLDSLPDDKMFHVKKYSKTAGFREVIFLGYSNQAKDDEDATSGPIGIYSGVCPPMFLQL